MPLRLPKKIRDVYAKQVRGPFLVYEGGERSVAGAHAEPRQARAQLFSELVLVSAAYFVCGRLGLAIPLTQANVSPVWPASGVALAALLIFGYRVWPAITLGALLVNFFTHIPHSAAFMIAIGNTVGPATGAFLLGRRSEFRVSLPRVSDVVALLGVGGLLGTLVSAVIGTSALFFSRVAPWSHFRAACTVWWLGDAMGVLIVTPLVTTLPKTIAISREHWAEFGALLAGTAAVSVLVFGSNIGAAIGAHVLVLGLVPFILWSAIRFELQGTVLVNLLIATVAVYETGRGFGPLARHDALLSVALLQSFLVLVIVPGTALATAVAERAHLAGEQATRAALQETENRYGGILETANGGIWILDSQFRTRFVNRRATELLGYTQDEMMGRSVLEFLFAEDIERKKASLERRRCGMSEQSVNRYRKKDGSELWAKVSTSPILNAKNEFEGCIKWISDVEDQVAAEESKSAVELLVLLSRAVQQTADSIMITDSTGIIEYVNPAFEAITGFAPEEAVGRTPRIVKSGRHGSEFYKKLWDCISEGKPYRGTLINRKKSGELYRGEQTITPVTDDAGNVTHYVSVVRDVTDSHRKQEQEVQLQLAREVQQRFYEKRVWVSDIDVDAAARPADETGGDYFDVIPMPDNSVYVGVGDISGHGLGSALVMALTRAYVHSFTELQLSVGEVLARTNRLLMADLEEGQFATLLLIHIAPDRHSLKFASAGHVPSLLLNSDGAVDRVLQSTAVPLGLFDHGNFPECEVEIKPEQMLVLITDGITEATNAEGKEFGVAGVLEYLRSHCDQSAATITNGLCEAAQNFSCADVQADDMTVVVLKFR